MSDLLLPNFPPSLLARLDRYIELLEELNPGYKWTRGAAVASLLARALAEIEGADVRNRRRSGMVDRRAEPRAPDRRHVPERRGGSDRRTPPYPEMVDLVIEHLLREGRGDDETWRDREDPED
ncbi:MAG TPA: hypothetical protein VIE88_13130 [Vicinamibacteria bacterium]|jgi:hypothetical protein